MIRTILEGGGAATRRQIATAISAADLSQVEYYEQVVARYPAKVLRNRGIVDYDKGVFRLSETYRQVSEWERAELRALCDKRVADFVAQRQDRIWAHRSANTDPVPGSLRWQVISRALGRCEACGVSSAERALEVDHIVPRSKGGSNELWNLQALCSLCNVQKLDRQAIDFHSIKAEASQSHPRCKLCNAPTFEDLENELGRVVVASSILLVAPRRHGASYVQLWQPEINALRQLELALVERRPDWTSLTSSMVPTGPDDSGHLAMRLSGMDKAISCT